MSVPSNVPKAIRAREILDQYRIGLEELRTHPRGSWFVLWAGTLSLLRTVGDALENDADKRIQTAQARWMGLMKQDNAAAGRGKSIEKHGDTWEPAIFWQFVRRDRNLLLHEARSTVSTSATIQLTGVSIRTSVGGDIPVFPAPQTPPPRATYSYTMSTPPYAGQDARDVVEQAIQWWEQQINDIERDAL
jgi:hypothetical protein